MKKIKGILGTMVIAAFLLSATPSIADSGIAYALGGEHEAMTPELQEQFTEISRQKEALTPAQRKIDSNILRVVRQIGERVLEAPLETRAGLGDISTTMVKVSDVGEIEVKLNVASMTDRQLEQLRALGMHTEINLPKYGIIEGSLSYDQVEAVAGLDFVRSVRTPGYALHNTGDINSEGDAVLRAAEARTAFGVDGSGLKVGVMSNGVTHLANSQASGDLPSVDVLSAGSRDEGTAMLEIIHDLAPGAELAFYSPSSSSDMVAGINTLETAGCDIIVDDITYLDEPKFEDGPIAQEARQFVSNGGVYVTSAGNDAQIHYIHQYVRTTSPGSGYDYVHDYGSGDVGNTFSVPNGGEIVAILQWNNKWGLSGDDFDLFLLRSSDQSVLVQGNDWQDGDDYPYEWVYWTNNTGSSLTVYIAIIEYSLVSDPSSLALDYHVYNNWSDDLGLEYPVSENSVIGHSAVEEVLSTAAAYCGTPNNIEDYSSRGPGTVYFPTYEQRQVPNIAGVDGVHTKTGQLDHFYDPFYGTSAAAPHVAAIAALVWDADPMLTPSEVHNAITSTAVDKGAAGYDYTWGWGLADALEAVASVIPFVTPPIVSTNAATSVEEITATLNGAISYDGGETCQYRFEYDTDSGEPYAYNTGWTGSKTTGQSFSAAISGFSKGTKYYFRAQAKNSAGTTSGSEMTFLTKPDAPTSFNATSTGQTQIDLSWTKGDGAQKTRIQRKEGSYPIDMNDGTQVYFDTGSDISDTGLSASTTYYYCAWSYVQGSQQWSDNYVQASATTEGMGIPTVGAVDPHFGDQGQTLNVTIIGTNFFDAYEVSFDEGIVVTAFTVDSGSQITAVITIAPDADLGPRDVSVTNPAGTGALTDGFTVTSSSVVVTRILPDAVMLGQEFEVTATFTSPANDFNAIGLADVAPAGWSVSVDRIRCSPDADAQNTPTFEEADYIWFGPYAAGAGFTAVYTVQVPGDATLGTYTFPDGTLEYYIGGEGPYTEAITGDYQVEVALAKITGETREVNCAILSGVTVTLYQDYVEIASTISDGDGHYELAVPELGDYVVVAIKDGFRDKTQTISVTEATTYTLNFVGDYGLIPNAPNMSYVLACINLWKFGTPPCNLNVSTVLAVINDWKFPI